MKSIEKIMITYLSFNNIKRFTFVVTLFMLSLQFSYSQKLPGKWECSKETLLEMGLGYTKMKGKCNFNKNGTFTLVIKGRSFMGHKSHPLRAMYVKVKGRYILDGIHITSMIEEKDIKASVEPDMEDPEFNPGIRKAENSTTWDFASTWYDREQLVCKVQEQTIKEKIINLWIWNKLPVTFDNENCLNIGNFIHLRK